MSFIRATGEGEGGEFDASEITDISLAEQVGAALNDHYPNHPWVISVQGGSLVLRHLSIAGAVAMATGDAGFSSLLPRNKLGTPKEVAQTAVRFGGELLEAFSLKRGAWHGEEATVPPDLIREVRNRRRVLQ